MPFRINLILFLPPSTYMPYRSYTDRRTYFCIINNMTLLLLSCKIKTKFFTNNINIDLIMNNKLLKKASEYVQRIRQILFTNYSKLENNI